MNEHAILPAHLSALGLGRNPFPSTPDADCYFRTENIEQQFTEALHCVLAGKGFMLLTGEVGTGKSTFLRSLMDQLITADCTVAFVFNTFLQGRDLLLAINRDFGLEAGADLAEDIDRLNHFLIEQHTQGKTSVVVIDDAQNLDTQSLELLRLLSNLETRQHKLLQIVLSGQPELLDILAKPEIRQLSSRIMQHTQLSAFTRAECARYIDFRISRAGSDGRIRLNKSAQDAVHRHSHGNPRRVHLIMDRCMYGVITSNQREISKHLVDIAAREVGVATRAYPPHPNRKGMMVILAFLGVGVAAWAGAPSSTKPNNTPIQTTTTLLLNSCLKEMDAERWQNVLENGLNMQIQPAIERSLAETGLTLARLPDEGSPPRYPGSYCQWKTSTGSWILWRPVHLPFELVDGAHGENVRWLQARLVATGHYTVAVDGVVGSHTIEALKAFRLQHGMPASSRADAWTLFLLESERGNKMG